MSTKTNDQLTPLEREERVLRILEKPERVDAFTRAAYQAQLARMRKLRSTLAPQVPDATPVPCAWHAQVEGAPA
jgi:hypothetical protein